MEGNVNRVKVIKTQMHGRVKIDLFRKRIRSPRDPLRGQLDHGNGLDSVFFPEG